MTATSHAIIGTVIAVKIGNPVLAVPLAIASHILADLIPHWDTATNAKTKGKKRVFTDTLIDICLGFFLSYLLVLFLFPTTSFSYVIVMILAAQSLDWLFAPYYFFNIKFTPFVWSYKFQKRLNSPLDKPWGIINQVAVLVLLILLAKIL